MRELKKVSVGEVRSRLPDFAQLFADVFRLPPWNESWLVHPEEGGDASNNATLYLDALLHQDPDIFAVWGEAGELFGFGVGLVLSELKIHQLGFHEYGALPGHYCSAVVAVHPASHGSGFGRKLVEARLQRAIELQCPELWVRVLRDHEPINRPYRALGFSVSGEQEITEGGVVTYRTVYRLSLNGSG